MLRLGKKHLNILGIFLVLLTVSSCQNFPPPKVERCGWVESTGELACYDGRLEEEEREYFREIRQGDIVTNGPDYGEMYKYVSELRKKLIECRRKKGRR